MTLKLSREMVLDAPLPGHPKERTPLIFANQASGDLGYSLRREGEDMKHLVLSLLACLAVGNGDSHDGDSDAPRRGCDLYEQPAGRIVNRETSLPFTRNDDCLKGVGTLLCDARAHAKAIEDVSAVLQRVFRLARQ